MRMSNFYGENRMRRSICTCEPATALAGEMRTWKFIYTPATSLPVGTILLFDLGTMGRPIDWETPGTSLKGSENVIWAKVEKGQPLAATEVQGANDLVPKYQFKLTSKISAGTPITIYMGDPKEKKWDENPKGTRAQTNSQRRRPFYLFIDTSGKGKFDEPETFAIDIRGNKLHSIKAITPSYVAKNRRFDALIRFEDQYGNLTSNVEKPDALIELTHENIRENLKWKLFIPETGFLTLPNLYFNEAGVYTIQLRNMVTKELFTSPPIRCLVDAQLHLYWGILHGESERVDSTENIESCLRHMRDEMAYNFFCCSPFENADETPNELWKTITQSLADLSEDDRYITFNGFQWQGEAKTEGARLFLYPKEQKQLLRKKDAKYNTLKKIYKTYAPKEMISIPTFTMGKGYEYDFKDWNKDFERVVEIYNSWGCSETTKKEGNQCPISPAKKKGVVEAPEGAIIQALNNNCRVGFVAGGLDDRGMYQEFYENEQNQYPPGLTSILAKGLSREALFEAIYNRSCYATTGERIIVGFTIAGAPMGSEIDTSEKQGLLVNRHINGHVAGTTKLHMVEIIRNGKVLHTYKPDTYFLDFSYDDMTPLEKNSLKGKDKEPPFAYYYIRVTQEDGHMAWGSPIWIDLVPGIKRDRTKLQKNNKQPREEVAPLLPIVEEDDFDYDDDE